MPNFAFVHRNQSHLVIYPKTHKTIACVIYAEVYLVLQFTLSVYDYEFLFIFLT